MERFVPAHVVVNREGEVVHYSTRTGKYLEAAAGAPSRHLLAMARRGLRLDLRAALHEAMETRHPAQRVGIEVELDGHMQPVTITVEPLDQDQTDPLFLVLFADQGPLLTPAEVPAQGRGTQDGGEATEQLEHELGEAQNRVQALIEQYETGLEELKVANEELVSMNEELQSTNEELQTAKEEQQSVNEELHTVNLDLHSKIEALDLANADLRNLFDSTRIATVFLDRNLVLRSFTPSLAEVFNLLPGDVGRPLTNITCELDYPELRADIEEVLQTGQPRERSVIRLNGLTHHLARIAPYRTKAGGMDGVIATFAEVTGIVRAEAHQRMLVAELNHRVKNTLAIVQGIAAASLERGPARDAFVQRLRALARAHDLLARDGWTSVSFAEIMRAEAAPYFANGQDRFSLSGPDLAVSPRVAQSLGLVIHELATNATKYGALSVERGHVDVLWSLTDEKDGPHLRLVWREMDGPPAATPLRRGFGSRVIEREVSAGLGGVSELQFGAEGLRAVIEVPLNARANRAAVIADR
jgi:two-component system, chemotaxis family, CheB/CheR fusion protein